MSFASGDRIGSYEIVSSLGAGGMGEVYRAKDTRLGREVALKILPGHLAADSDRLSRFYREARAVAALNHPSVVTLYSVEESGGRHFLTMELVDGAPLDAVIPRDGLPIERAVDVAAAVADAIAAAHEKGIVHRDLKPANVMIARDGRVKVLDFGLAKEVRAPVPDEATMAALDRTQAGVVMGTPSYMSPEQIAGTAVDHRTDVFSIGLLLYEMATGRRPFQGRTHAELAASILRDPPPDLSKTNVPSAVAALIERCLAKTPDDRVQTAQSLASQLRSATRLSATPGTPAKAAASDEGFWVAVAPFRADAGRSELTALAEGLSEEIVAGLSRFPYLRVLTSGSAGACYVLEGSLRQAGAQLRVSVRLMDTTTGASLWAENYTRPFSPDAIFDIQDSLVPTIVSTVGETNGVLTHNMWTVLRERDPRTLTVYEALLRSFGEMEAPSLDERRHAQDALEQAIQREPNHSGCLAMLAGIHGHEYGLSAGEDPQLLEQCLAYARRAVAAEPSNYLAFHALAMAHFFRRDLIGFRSAAERALALNPLDGYTAASIGMRLAYTGEWRRGCELVERAMHLNPRHPGWYWFPLASHAYYQRDFRAALDLATKANLSGHPYWPALLVAAHGQLGNATEARHAIRDLLALRPDFVADGRRGFERYFYAQPELLDLFVEGWRKAGLPMADDRRPAAASAPSQSVAVLPFANLSADKEQEYFSDGLAEEIINLLVQVDGLKVIARTSSFAFRGKEEDIRKIADALDVTHVLEGSVRRAGGRIRVTAQLIAAADGGHVWSERYDRELSDIFAVQDEIAAAITGALRLKLSGQAPSAARYRPALPAYEAVLKAKHHVAKVTPESLELSKACYESAIALDPAYGLAHVGVGFYWLTLTMFGQCPPHDGVASARSAVLRALQIDRSIPEAHALLGYLAAFYDRDWEAAERHFEAPMAKQAGLPIIRPVYSALEFFRGNVAQAIALAERAIEEDPLEVWPRMNLHAYLQAAGRDRDAYEQTLKVLELDGNLVVARVSIAHFHAAWGERREAVAAARQAHAVGPWYPDAIATLAAVLRWAGDEEESRALYRSLGSGKDAGDARAQAVYYLLCGDVETGADWAEKAVAEHDHSILYYLRFVIAKGLRASGRWPKIARMLNLPTPAQM